MVEVVRTDVGIVVPGEAEGSSQSPQKQEQAHNEAIEEKASGLGWKPQTEWQGDVADWRPAKEFLDRQSLFDKIRSVKDENFHLKRDLNVIKDYVKKMSDIEYKRALRDLNAEKRAAISDADVEKAEVIETQIAELKETRTEVKQEVNNGGVHPAFVEWQVQNKWYQTDSELRSEADQLGVGYSAMHKDAPPETVLAYVSERIKRMYPEKFSDGTSKKERGAPSVEGGGSRRTPTSKSGKYSESDLDPMERQVMTALVKRGVMTKEKYLEDLAIAKGQN